MPGGPGRSAGLRPHQVPRQRGAQPPPRVVRTFFPSAVPCALVARTVRIHRPITRRASASRAPGGFLAPIRRGGGPRCGGLTRLPDGEGLASAHGRAPTLRVPGGGGGPRAAAANRTTAPGPAPPPHPLPQLVLAPPVSPPPLRDGAGRGGRHSACRRRSPLASRIHRLRRRPAPKRTAATCPPRPPVAAAFVQVGRAGWSAAGGGWRAAVLVCVPRSLTIESAWSVVFYSCLLWRDEPTACSHATRSEAPPT